VLNPITSLAITGNRVSPYLQHDSVVRFVMRVSCAMGVNGALWAVSRGTLHPNAQLSLPVVLQRQLSSMHLVDGTALHNALQYTLHLFSSCQACNLLCFTMMLCWTLVVLSKLLPCTTIQRDAAGRG